MRRLGVVVLWLLAALGTASLTYAAVSSAGSAVGENPSPPVAGADIAARISTTTSGVEIVVTSTSLPVTTAVPPSMPLTTTTLAGGGTSTTVSTTTVTTTTGTTTQHWKTVPGGGTVGVAVSGGSVTLVSATPVAPYQVDVEDDGPEKVEVEFDSEAAEYRVRAEIHDGQLIWQVEQSGEGGDDGG